MLLAMPLVVRGWTAFLRATPRFGTETTQEEEYQTCNSVSLCGMEVWNWSPPGRCVAQWHHNGTCRWLTVLWVGVKYRNDRGQVQREGSQGTAHILAPERTNCNTFFFLELHIFKARDGLHFFLFLFFFGGFGPVFEKVLLRYQYILKKLFSLFSICFLFFSLKMHKCSTETKKSIKIDLAKINIQTGVT